ncbi:hypothetical protein [Streptomyces sp. NRRL F-5135]|uniref:hypothetical protein n=1 Tax=Streptomyces sp. NRRL F-5135 TaxID=1463858 RepID=UPI0004C812CA|nr:hypothetical protein [Streptomyces sp. NRRL F-5135]
MTHSGQRDEPQQPAARITYEGIVLPSDGSGPWIPGSTADQDPPARSSAPAPASAPPAAPMPDSAPLPGPVSGEQWGQSWGAQDGQGGQGGYGQAATQPYGGQQQIPPQPPLQPQPQAYGEPQSYGQPQAYGESQPYGESQAYGQPQSYGESQAYGQPQRQGQPYGAPQGDLPHGGSYGAPLPPPAQGLPLPAETPPVPGVEDATQYLPPVAATSDSDATQFIAPVPQAPGPVGAGVLPPESGAEATQVMRPPQVPEAPAPMPPHQGADSDATQFLPPVAAPEPPAAAPYDVRPGAPEDRQPPPEFDNLFRAEGGGAQGADMTRPLPPYGAGGPAAPGPGAAGGASRSRAQPQPHAQPSHAQPPHAQPSHAPPHAQPPVPVPTPSPAPERRASRGRGDARRGSSKVPVVAAVVIGCAVLGLGAGALMSGGDGKSAQNEKQTLTAESSPTAPATSEPPADPAQPQAEALDKLLADSNNSRSTVINAVESIKSCENLDKAATDLHGAAEQRRDLVTRLKDLSVDKLPDHAELTSSLNEAWEASASADDHYAQWAKQAKSKKVCKGGHAKATKEAAKGNKASGEATAAKQKASQLWNAVATKYGLTPRKPTQL